MKVYPLKVSFDSFSIFFAWSACTWWLYSSVNFVWGLRTPNCVSLVERKEKSRSLINKYDLSYTNIYVVFILGSIEDRISNSVHKDTTFLILYLIFSCVQKAERKHHPWSINISSCLPKTCLVITLILGVYKTRDFLIVHQQRDGDFKRLTRSCFCPKAKFSTIELNHKHWKQEEVELFWSH